MKTVSRAKDLLLGLAILLGGVIPVLLYNHFSVELPAMPSPTDVRPMTDLEQWFAVIVAFGVKPVYMLVSLILIIWLWRQRSPDLAALRWGLIVFWLGENACSINYVVFAGRCEFWEFLHDYGMAVAFSFIAYAALEGIDIRIFKYSAPKERCVMLSLCRGCIKYSNVPCKLRCIFALTIPALIAVAMMPLCASPKWIVYDVSILGKTYTYTHLMSSQLFESRYCPILAIVSLASAWLCLWFKREPVALAKVLFAAAMGPLGFGLMRLFLYSAYSEKLLWFEDWEEITELIFTISVMYVLWLFRSAVFQPKEALAQSDS